MIYEFEKISQCDGDILAEIHKQCFLSAWSAQTFYNMLMDKHFFGFICYVNADLQHIPAGFILCKKIFDEIEIITFGVVFQLRRCGIGKKLMSAIIKSANDAMPDVSKQGCNSVKIFLEVAKNNFAAINLYHSLGFKKISERINYYKTADGTINAIVMRLELAII